MHKSKWFAILSFPLILIPFLAFPRVEAVVPPSSPESASQAQIFAGNGIVASVLAEADRLSTVYGSQPPWNGQKFAVGERLTPEQALHALPYVIACESGDKSVKIVDSNGYYSYGILQFQSSTWAGFVKESGMGGDPMVKRDAVRMALWAFEHGYLYKWSCAHILRLINST